jgi:hypothetical protein
MLIRYYKVGRFLHVVATLAFTVAFYAGILLLELQETTESLAWYAWLYVLVVFLVMAILAELDGYSRFQNYKQVKDQLFCNGYQERLLKPLERSSCQREAAILAGDELGIGNQIRKYYYAKGYRWYHIIPDFVFQYPLFFFSAYFWRTTFFTPYYKPKIDYAKLDLMSNDFMLKGINSE